MDYRLQKNFFQKELIELLTKGVPSHPELVPLKPAQANRIANGFCFSLVVDWLANANSAEKYYWKNNMKDNECEHLFEFISSGMNELRYNYFKKLAVQFCDYCANVNDIFNKNVENVTCANPNGIEGSFVISNRVVTATENNKYLNINAYKNFKFGTFGSCDDNNLESKLVPFFDSIDKNNPKYYAMLLNIYFFDTTKTSLIGNPIRHSIGVQKVNVVGANAAYYIVFDPNRVGVYISKDVVEVINKKILPKYKKDNKFLALLYYNIESRIKNDYKPC